MRYYRTTAFHPRVAAAILERIADGEPLSRICGPDRAAGLPQSQTVYKWMKLFPNFRAAYETAKWMRRDRRGDLELATIVVADRGGRPAHPKAPRAAATRPF